jgi:F-type H+-transporting ATPase subunit gamma
MANLKDIRSRISSVQNTQQITSAMKMVAAAKLRKAQQRMENTRPYAKKLSGTVSNLAQSNDHGNVFMTQKESIESVLLIVVGSDRGLCGGFNNNLFKEIDQHISSELSDIKSAGNLTLVCVGRKAHEYYKKRGYNLVGNYSGFFDDLKYERISSLMKEVRHDFSHGLFDRVEVAFNEFKSIIAQNRVIKTVLPVQTSEVSEEDVPNVDYIFEPDVASILDAIIPQFIDLIVWQAILESNASEQGARMAAMDNATENAKEIVKDLKLDYNKARQAAITTEISEIVSGAEALKEK